MHNSSSPLPAPGRLFLPGCAIAAGLLAVASPLLAAPVTKSRLRSAAENWAQPQQLRVGKAVSYPLSSREKVRVDVGGDKIVWNANADGLNLKVIATGIARLRISAPHQPDRLILLKLVPAKVKRQPQIAFAAASRLSAPAIVPGILPPGLPQPGTNPAPGTSPGTAPGSDGGVTIPLRDATVTTASPTSEQAPNLNLGALTTGTGTGLVPDLGVPANPALGANGQSPLLPDATGQSGFVAPPAPPLPSLATPSFTSPTFVAPAPRVAAPPAIRAARPAPRSGIRAAPRNNTPLRRPVQTQVVRGGVSTAATPSRAQTRVQISPSLPLPARSPRAVVGYRTAQKLPRSVGKSGGYQTISVTQGLARFITFQNNILAVYFSNPGTMDARAINARTIAVSGVGPGPSTLAVFTAQYPGDAVGRANIYRIETGAPGGTVTTQDPRAIADAISAALGDPRVRASIISGPDGTLAARLSGTVRNQSEVDAAKTTAAFFVPNVISSLYADINSPSLEAITNGTASMTPEAGLQENLRRATGNNSIEIVPLGGGIAFKAEVDSPAEAEALLRVLPSLNQQVMPFIVVHNQPNSARYYNATVPLLSGEDRQLTSKLQEVTGISTVYAVRTSSNSLACYGNVRTRGEYDAVRRYMNIAAQTAVPPAIQGTSQGGSTLRPQGQEGGRLPNYDPVGGYYRNLGLQMFVNITDPGQSVIRKVTVETSIVEISRTALRNLGFEYGTVSVLTQTQSGGDAVITPSTVAGQPSTVTVNPVITNSTIDPTFLPGTALAGTGFAGGQSLRNINPFRVRLNALVNNGDARILSRPNVTSLEGASAQITIGGERPVPKAVATQGAVGTQVEFRRFGVIISMRPTVTNNNTIILQIRADITQPDRTYEINLNGALIPGESVRSVDTTLNVRPGDTIVMGGLITNDRRQQTSKVPILGDLPIIGSLFQSRRFENNETELAIFMTPQIEAMPADRETIEDMLAHPSFPGLPSRQESNGILFQETTRTAG